MIEYLMFSLGLVPFLATRVFTPLFWSLAFARLGPQYEWLARFEGVEVLSHVPVWALTDTSLGVSFLLMCVELAAEKSPDLRELMGLFDTKAKALVAFALCSAMASGDFVVTQSASLGNSSFLPLAFLGSNSSPPVWAYVWATLISFLVWLTAVVRRTIFTSLAEMDPDDDLGLARLLSWGEDIFGVFFFFLAVALPVLAVAIAGAVVLALFVTRKILEAREQRQKVPCQACGTPNPLCGVVCSRCGHARSDVRQVGPLGGIRGTPVMDARLHHFELLGRRRCPACGERLQDRGMSQPCRACRRPAFLSAAEAEAYLEGLQGKLGKTLLVLTVCSFFPLIGLIPGILYYRITLISSLRSYLPLSVSFFSRWIVRVINLVLLCLQPIPGIGMLALPAMCLTSFYFYRMLLKRQIAGQLAPPPLPVPLRV